MGKSRKEFENAIVWLSSSEDEDEVIKHLTYIVKGFSSHMYKETILSNPYYKDLFLDVREDVMDDLDNLEKSLLDEIYSIEKSLSGSGKQISEKLKDLKRDCELLIDEIEAKREELQSFL
jgi:hypothetical protein